MKTKSVVYTEKTYLKTMDSSSLVLSDLGMLVAHRIPVSDLISYVAKRLSASEESFIDVWVDRDSNILAFDLENVIGLFVTTLTDQDGKILEIKLTPERTEKDNN